MKNTPLPTSNKWLVPSVSVLGLLLVMLYALGIIGGVDQVVPGTTETAGFPLPANAQTFTVGSQTTENLLAWPGSVKSRTVAKIAPKLAARIVEVNVQTGNKVGQGDIIARLDERVYRAAYNEAVAALNAAKANYSEAAADSRRIQDLYSKEAATRQDYDTVTARARAAKATVSQAASAVEQAKVNLGESELRAPFAGVIAARLKEPGDMGLPNDPVVILQQPEDLRFEAAIPSSCARRVRLGLPVTIRIDHFDGPLEASISEIAPEIDQATRTQLVKADIKVSDALQPGLFGWLDLSCSDASRALFVPVAAVLHYGQLEAVRVVENNRVYTRHVRTGKRQGDFVEILSGLKSGETLLSNSGLEL